MESSTSHAKPRVLIAALAAFVLICSGIACLLATLPAGVLGLYLAQNPAQETRSAITITPILTDTHVPTLTPGSRIETATATEIRPAATAALPSTSQSVPTEAGTSPPLPSPPNPTRLPVALDAWCIPWNSPASRAVVQRVLDGVTIEVTLDGKMQTVRYIGVDLLETNDDSQTWSQMTEANRSLVEGKTVLLVRSIGLDENGEALARYVLADGVFVNLELAQRGYAVAHSTPPDTGCDPVFEEAQNQAMLARRGLWAPAPIPTRTLVLPTATVSTTGDVVIVQVVYSGTVWQEPDEYVEILNSGTEPVQLAGWSLSDNQRHTFVFPRLIMKAGDFCRVYTNLYAPWHCGLSYYNPSPIWDNHGDCAFLRDNQGKLVDVFCYD